MSRLLAVLGALWVVFGAPAAFAATRVPMCGEHAQTVIAPPISRSASNASLRGSPCEDRGPQGFTLGNPERQNDASAAPELVPRMPPLYHRPYPVPRTRAVTEPAQSGELRAHATAIERPPR